MQILPSQICNGHSVAKFEFATEVCNDNSVSICKGTFVANPLQIHVQWIIRCK